MKPKRVAVPLWFLLAMLTSVAAISALMVFIAIDASPSHAGEEFRDTFTNQR